MVHIVLYLPAILALVGLIVYALSVNPKSGEVGRLVFMIGFLIWLFRLGGK